MDIDLEVKGFAQLDDALAAMGAEAGVKTLKMALSDSTKPMLEDMQAHVPVHKGIRKDRSGNEVQPGSLRDSLGRRYQVGRYGSAVEVHVGVVSKKTAWYARFVEFGTAPHYLNRGAKRTVAGRRVSGRRFYSKASLRKKHPGAKAQPFIRPAFDRHAIEASNILATRLAKRIENAARRKARK